MHVARGVTITLEQDEFSPTLITKLSWCDLT